MILWLERRRPAWRKPGPWLVAIAVAIPWLLWLSTSPPAPEPEAAQATRPRVPLVAAGGPVAHPAPTSRSIATQDPLAHSGDLKREFDRLLAGGDGAQAARAWQACVPAFLPSADATPSPEAMIAALPAQDRAPREAAWRALWLRCQGFFAQPRGELLAQAATMRTRAATPGAAVLQALARGETLARADRVLASDEAAAMASLSGLARRWFESHDADVPAAAEATDAALAVIDCDLGAACSADSLAALQLCAAEALCAGDVVERRLARFGPGLDRGAVDGERLRLAAALRAGVRDAAGLLQLR